MPVHVVAIVVAYRPELALLDQVIESLVDQVTSIIVVNNGAETELVDWGRSYPQVRLLAMGSNRGIAAAQNRGIAVARDDGATHVLLMDQDSVVAPGMTAKLLAALGCKSLAASVGPRYTDDRQDNPPPFIQVRGLKLYRMACSTVDSIVPVDYLIASGCLIPMSVIDRVGGMREDLFIDYVDIEWGLRARSQGLQSYGVCGALMSHCLGEQPIRFFGKAIPLHSPLRHYYHFRNAVLLYRESWVPGNWKLVDGYRLCLKFVFYSLFASPRLAHLRMMAVGVFHGLRGRGGAYVE